MLTTPFVSEVLPETPGLDFNQPLYWEWDSAFVQA
eukprot:gene14725-8518_t